MDPLTLDALGRGEWLPLFRAGMTLLLLLAAGLYLRAALRRRGLTLDLFFAATLATALLALHFGPPFHDAATRAFERTEIPAALRDADTRIERVESMPSDWWRSFQGSIGLIREDARPDPPAAVEEERVGARIHAALVSMLAAGLRVATLAFASLAVALLVGLRTLTSRRPRDAAAEAMQRRVQELEAELAGWRETEESGDEDERDA